MARVSVKSFDYLARCNELVSTSTLAIQRTDLLIQDLARVLIFRTPQDQKALPVFGLTPMPFSADQAYTSS